MLLWFSLSVISVFYNAVKSVSEIREWMPLTYDEKRAKIFGNAHHFFVFVSDHTSTREHIFLYSKDVKTFYLSKYYLYPRIVDSTDNYQEFEKKVNENKYDYVATDSLTLAPNIAGYTKVASLEAKENGAYMLYKRK